MNDGPTVEYEGHVCCLGENWDHHADDDVRLRLTPDDGRPDEVWTVKRDKFDEPDKLERGTYVEVTASADGVEFRRVDVPEWSDEEIEAAKERAKEMRRKLFE